MNAQQTTSVVNLISAQPAKVTATSFSDANAQSFADILGSQRTQPAAPAPQYRSPAPASNNSAAQSGNSPAQSAPTNTQQASSTPAPQASSASTTSAQQSTSSAETSQDPTAANGAVASNTSNSGANDTSNSGAPDTDASPQANKQAVTDDEAAANPVALAMSDLAAAVAQVFMARHASGTPATGAEAALVTNDTSATADATRPNGANLAQNAQVLTGFLQEAADSRANQRDLAENSLSASQRVGADPATNDTRLAFTNDTRLAFTNDPRLAVSGRARPASSADADALRGQTPASAVQATTDAARENADSALARLNQRADTLDRDARLDANARLAPEKAAGRNASSTASEIESRAFNTLSESSLKADADLKSNFIAAANSTFGRESAQSQPQVATPLTEASIGLAPTPTSFAPGSMAAPLVSTPLGHPQWGNDFSQQVAGISQTLKNGLQTIEMRLDPPDLGPIR
ncbi:MAG: hypothetical protein GX086_11370, partial [Alcaligenaceae bacterium]|nr:hypothetical protein [Alcaligenaceae bacterium]